MSFLQQEKCPKQTEETLLITVIGDQGQRQLATIPITCKANLPPVLPSRLKSEEIADFVDKHRCTRHCRYR